MTVKMQSLDFTFNYFLDVIPNGVVPRVACDLGNDTIIVFPPEHYLSQYDFNTDQEITEDYIKSKALDLQKSLEAIISPYANSALYVTLRHSINTCSVSKHESEVASEKKIVSLWTQTITRIDATGEIFFYNNDGYNIGWKRFESVETTTNTRKSNKLTAGKLIDLLKTVDPNLEVRLEYDSCLISVAEYAGVIKIDATEHPDSFAFDIDLYTPEFFILADAANFGSMFKEMAEDYDIKCTTVDLYSQTKDEQ